MKLTLKLKTLWQVFLLTLRAVPVNCIFALFLSITLMLYYTFSVSIVASLFESVDAYYRSDTSSPNQIIIYVALFVGMRFLQSIIIFLNGLNGNVFIYRKANNYYRKILSDKASQLPLIKYEDAYVNDMFTRAQTVVNEERLSQQYMAILSTINNCFTVIGIAAVLCAYNPWLLVIAIPSVIPFFIIRLIRGKEFYKMKYFQAKKNRHMGYYWSLLFNKDSIKEMRAFDFSDYIEKKWRGYRDEVDQQNWEFSRKDSASMLLSNFISTCGYVLSIVFSIYLMVNGKINVGVFGACLSAFLSMQNTSKSFLMNIGNISEHLLFSKDYLDFIDLPNASDGSISLNGIPKIIKMNQVSFRYPNSDNYVLKDVSLEIHQGEKLILVGENGSGKTTLIKLLLGLYEPESGEILYDGIPLSQIKKDSIYKTISLMMQNSLKHQSTVQETVALSEIEHIDDEERIMNALRAADIDYILEEEGIKTRLGKEFKGKELSGGEWQKIALARALFKNSDFVILDEPTSAIDPIVEMDILKKFLDNAKKKTAVIISHRVGICTCADTVVMLSRGQIVERGSHTALMKKRGQYYDFFTMQSKWYN